MIMNSNISKLIKKILSEDARESVIKFGMKDKAGNTKIADLQRALKIKSARTNKFIVTGFFGDLTNDTLLQKVPDLYSGKNDVINDDKYNRIIAKLKTLPDSPNERNDRTGNTNYISSINFNSLWKNFPKGSQAGEIFPIIFPTAYAQYPDSFANLCATRLSLALNNVGIKPTPQFKTEKDLNWGGVTYKKGQPITVRAKSTPQYLKNYFGNPSVTFENTEENAKKYLKGKKGIFVITGVPGWTATGHADIFFDNNNTFECGHSCYFGSGGKLQAWFIK